MANFFNTPLFGLTLSVLDYTIGLLIYRRFPNPLTTPLLVSTALIIVILHYTGISYKDYYVGGSYLNSLIIPSTVALAVPFYKNLHLMRHHYKSILIGSTVACVLNTSYTALIAKLFGMDYFLAISLFPKSVTTAMAVGISEKMQGITTVTLVVVVITGILTSVLGPVFLKMIYTAYTVTLRSFSASYNAFHSRKVCASRAYFVLRIAASPPEISMSRI